MPCRKNRQFGTSLIEMVFAVGVLLIITAIAVPSINSVYRTYQLISNANALSGIVQRTRSVAVGQNAPASLGIDTKKIFSINTTVPLTKPEQKLALDRGIGVSTSPPKLLTTKDLGSSSLTVITTASANNEIYFNARGIPCDPNATNCMTPLPKSAYVYYLTDGKRWAAVSVNPAGRVGIWTLGGTEWQQHK